MVARENKQQLIDEIRTLKKEKNAVILAHYYQVPEIQDIADFVGDSLYLSKQASTTNADLIVFAGVRFMAETAKILNPDKKVVLPDNSAGCSLETSCQPAEFTDFLNRYPDHLVVSYINCSAEIKAKSDVICTSSNAEKIIKNMPPGIPIIFAPDRNLGSYLKRKTGKPLRLWDGTCIVHQSFSVKKLVRLIAEHPGITVVAHPESDPSVLYLANYVGSTAGMLNYVQQSDQREFIVATEAGILHKMREATPDKLLIPAPVVEENDCACSECGFMKLNTLEKLRDCMKNELPEIDVPPHILNKANVPLQRMFSISEGKPVEF